MESLPARLNVSDGKSWDGLYSTCASPVVPHLSTRHAHGCLASEIGRDPAFPTRYDRTEDSCRVTSPDNKRLHSPGAIIIVEFHHKRAPQLPTSRQPERPTCEGGSRFFVERLCQQLQSAILVGQIAGLLCLSNLKKQPIYTSAEYI